MGVIMTLDFQTLANIIAFIAFSVIGYMYTQLVENHKALEKEVIDLRVNLPQNYVSRGDMMSHLNRIETMLNKIFDRLEQKADK